jgi:hypothetical protein
MGDGVKTKDDKNMILFSGGNIFVLLSWGSVCPHVSEILMKKWLLPKKRKRTLWALYSLINRTMTTYPQSIDGNSNETR